MDGEQKFNKAVRDAQRNVRVMQSDLKAETAAFGKNSDAQKVNQAKAESLKKQIEQQEKVVKALEGAVDEAAHNYGEAAAKTDGYRIKLANAKAELARMQSAEQSVAAELKKAASAEDEAGNKAQTLGERIKAAAEKMQPGLKNAASSAKDALNDMAAAGAAVFGAVTGAAAAALKEIYDLERGAALAADDLLTKSTITGIDTSTLQAWGYASNFIDVSVDTMTGAIKKLRLNMDSDSADVKKAFKRLGISPKDAKGYRESVDVFWDIVNAVGALGDKVSTTEKENMLQALFGKSYDDLLPLLNAGKDTFDNLVGEAYDKGLVQDEDTVKRFGALNDVLEKMDKNFEGIGTTIATILESSFTPLAEKAEKLTSTFNKWLKGEASGDDLAAAVEAMITQVQASVETGIAAIETVIGGLKDSDNGIVAGLGAALESVLGVFKWLSESDNYTKVAEAVGAIGAAFAAVKLAEFVSSMFSLKGVFTLIIAAVAAIIANWDGVVAGVQSAIDKVKEFLGLTEPKGRGYGHEQAVSEYVAAWADKEKIAWDMKTGTRMYGSEERWAINSKTGAALEAAYQKLAEEMGPNTAKEFVAQFEKEMAANPPDFSGDEWAISLPAEWFDGTEGQLQSDLSGMNFTCLVNGTLKINKITGMPEGAMLGGMSGPLNVDGEHATGLDYVPWDNYLAFLHRGETVLRAPEARTYRESGGNSSGGGNMRELAGYILQGMQNIRVDMDGKRVGKLVAETVDSEIGAAARARRVTV